LSRLRRTLAFVLPISQPNLVAIAAGGIRNLFGFTTGIRAGVRTRPSRVSNTPRRPSPSRSRISNTAGHSSLRIIGFACSRPVGHPAAIVIRTSALNAAGMIRSTLVHAAWVGYRTESRLWREGVRTWDDFRERSQRLP